jgi:hypothetical protein
LRRERSIAAGATECDIDGTGTEVDDEAGERCRSLILVLELQL